MRALSLQARRGEIEFGSMYEVQILLATIPLDSLLKDLHGLLHPCTSILDGPADPLVFMAAERLTLASIDSKTMGCTSRGK